MNAECIKVLLVEDNPGDARLVEIALSEPGPVMFKLDRVGLLSAALRRLEKDQFELILLDLSLPDSHGLDTVVAVRKKHQDVPIVVLTGLDNETNALEALRIGAQDYLVKGTATGETLRRTIRYAIERRKILKDLKNHQYISEEDEREIQDVLKAYRVFADSNKSPFVATTSEKEPLSVRMPKFVEDMSELYNEYFEANVCENKNESEEIQVDALIERLADKGAGPRDIMAMHLQCVEARQDTDNKKNNKSLVLQGQFIALEVLGHLVNAYRKNGLKVKESV
jgi:DNA-binding response OmpR family regulator